MASIELKAVEKWYGEVQVIKGVDLSIEEGEFIIFVGPSGCGKSTLLRMIAGLEETSRGQIIIGGRDATAEPPSKRGLAMVFQSYALYPHMSVRDNVGFPLKSAGVPKDQIDAKVNEAARVLKPGGRAILVDFAPHDLEELRDQHTHRWLGFSEDEIARMAGAAGLSLEPAGRLAGDPLTVCLWSARKADSSDLITDSTDAAVLRAAS